MLSLQIFVKSVNFTLGNPGSREQATGYIRPRGKVILESTFKITKVKQKRIKSSKF